MLSARALLIQASGYSVGGPAWALADGVGVATDADTTGASGKVSGIADAEGGGVGAWGLALGVSRAMTGVSLGAVRELLHAGAQRTIRHPRSRRVMGAEYSNARSFAIVDGVDEATLRGT